MHCVWPDSVTQGGYYLSCSLHISRIAAHILSVHKKDRLLSRQDIEETMKFVTKYRRKYPLDDSLCDCATDGQSTGEHIAEYLRLEQAESEAKLARWDRLEKADHTLTAVELRSVDILEQKKRWEAIMRAHKQPA